MMPIWNAKAAKAAKEYIVDPPARTMPLIKEKRPAVASRPREIPLSVRIVGKVAIAPA
jgi:hypothetical protein